MFVVGGGGIYHAASIYKNQMILYISLTFMFDFLKFIIIVCQVDVFPLVFNNFVQVTRSKELSNLVYREEYSKV